MAFLDDLAAGKFGFVVVPPEHLSLTTQDTSVATFEDPEHQLAWWFFYFPDLHFELSAARLPLLRRDAHRHARVMFEKAFEVTAQAEDLPADQRPRTDDLTWTPIIEIERFEVEGGAALSVLHRMHYQPGRESILGHTLVPVEGGLFEARWLAVSQMTGVRESVLMVKSDTENDKKSFLPQATMDDPEYDALFPAHPLSLVRAAKRWHEGRLRVTAPPPAWPTGEHRLAPIECAITVPPRFILEGTTAEPGAVTCTFTRVSFCGTDGIEQLVVTRLTDRIRGIAVSRRLARLARERSRALYEGAGYLNVECTVRALDSDPPSVVVVTGGDPQQASSSRGRAVWRWFLDDASQVWWIAMLTNEAIPLEELSDEVGDVVRSWRRLN